MARMDVGKSRRVSVQQFLQKIFFQRLKSERRPAVVTRDHLGRDFLDLGRVLILVTTTTKTTIRRKRRFALPKSVI